MVQNVNPTFVKTPNRGFAQVSTANAAGAVVSVYTAGVNGSKIISIMATATTTNALDLQIGVLNATSSFELLGTVIIPAAAGSTDSIPSVNCMATQFLIGLPNDSDGNAFFFLASTADAVAVKAPTAVTTTGGAINVTVHSGDF